MSRFKRNDGSMTRKSDFTLVLIIPMGILTTDFKNDTLKCQFRAARHKLESLRRAYFPLNSYSQSSADFRIGRSDPKLLYLFANFIAKSSITSSII